MAKASLSLIRTQVKFIKFFAWEERWIGKALDAREVEMNWMIKGISQETTLVESGPFLLFAFTARVNSVLFFLIWTCAPIFVSIISFMTYVMQGNQLTISTAFTVRHFPSF